MRKDLKRKPNDFILKYHRYIVYSANNFDEILGAYNNLGLAKDQFLQYFTEFPGKYVIVDTKDNSKFTITVME